MDETKLRIGSKEELVVSEDDFYRDCEDIKTEFLKLHEENKESLRQGMFVHSHELINSIHSLLWSHANVTQWAFNRGVGGGYGRAPEIDSYLHSSEIFFSGIPPELLQVIGISEDTMTHPFWHPDRYWHFPTDAEVKSKFPFIRTLGIV
jgi:hypothetical protein